MNPRLLPASLHIFNTYLLRRKRDPILASFKITYHCNLRCAQCPFYPMAGPELSFSQSLSILDQLYKRGSRIVIFEGGEPLLWHDGDKTLADVLKFARKKFHCTGLVTNGTLPLRDLPADVVWVSLDGLAETHNRLRGAPIFSQVIQHIEQSHHPKLLAHITVNCENADEIPALLRYLQGKVRGATVQFYYPYHKKDELYLEFGRRERLLDELIALKQQGYPLLNSIPSMQALKHNTWRCVDWLVDNANPDGSFQQGCYLRGRSDIDCARCGFSPHTEASLAWQFNLQAVWAGLRIFYL